MTSAHAREATFREILRVASPLTGIEGLAVLVERSCPFVQSSQHRQGRVTCLLMASGNVRKAKTGCIETQPAVRGRLERCQGFCRWVNVCCNWTSNAASGIDSQRDTRCFRESQSSSFAHTPELANATKGSANLLAAKGKRFLRTEGGLLLSRRAGNKSLKSAVSLHQLFVLIILLNTSLFALLPRVRNNEAHCKHHRSICCSVHGCHGSC